MMIYGSGISPFAPKILKIAGDEAIAVATETKELPPLLDYPEGAVPAAGFLIEDRRTLADIAVASPFVSHIGVDIRRWPNTVAYLERMLARPSFAGLVATERTLVARMMA